jgi:hypothetical protein
MRHSLPYASSGPSIPPSSHEPLEFHQVADTDEGPPSRENDLWVQPSEVCPLPGHKADDSVVDLQQDALAVRRVPLTDADELPPAQRMERMRDADKVCSKDGTGCILR